MAYDIQITRNTHSCGKEQILYIAFNRKRLLISVNLNGVCASDRMRSRNIVRKKDLIISKPRCLRRKRTQIIVTRSVQKIELIRDRIFFAYITVVKASGTENEFN